MNYYHIKNDESEIWINLDHIVKIKVRAYKPDVYWVSMANGEQYDIPKEEAEKILKAK